MADPTGSGFLGLEKVVDWLWALVLAAFAWGWKHTHKRIDLLQSAIVILQDTKAEKMEFDRYRDHVTRIHERLDEQGKCLARIEAKVDMMKAKS